MKSLRFALACFLVACGAWPLGAQDSAGSSAAGPAGGTGSEAQAPAEASTAKPGAYGPVKGLENWSSVVDLKSYKPGTYNIVVRARDAAGNESFAGPFNIAVDPASDLPRARIAHPTPLLRVGADLNVVGTAVDDDGIAYVELRVDGGEWRRAEGGEYWSYYLDTKTLSDGPRSLEVRAVDINGLAGPADAVRFNLDRTKPAAEIADPGFGALVSGRFAVNGTVSDANGLSSLSYSLDDGASWKALRLKLNKAKTQASFSIPVDTRKMEDGPAVLWLKGRDGVGSEGVSVFLFFVDNARPELELYAPAAAAAVNGRFVVTGRASDAVGLASLLWTLGKESGEIALVPGNPYFTVELDAAAAGNRAVLKLSARDKAGNLSSLERSWAVDQRADLPLVVLSRPARGAELELPFSIAGSVIDDDGAAAVEWRIDSGPASRVDTDGAFALSVDGAAPGRRSLFVRGVDVYGAVGPWAEYPITVRGAAPRLRIDSMQDRTGARPFAPGAGLDILDGKAGLSLSFEAANGLAELNYTVNGLPAAPLKPARGALSGAVSLPLPASMPFGILRIAVRATDLAGRVGEIKTLVYATNFASIGGPARIDFGLGDDEGRAGDAPLRLPVGERLVGRFITPFDADTLTSVSLESPSDLVAVRLEGGRPVIEAVAPGLAEGVALKGLSSRGHSVLAGPFAIATDSEAPELRILSPAFGSWRAGAFELALGVSDPGGLARVEYRVAGGEWTAPSVAGGRYLATVDPPAADGPLVIEARAIDRAGNEARAVTAAELDRQAPVARRILPEDGAPSAGRRLYVVEIDEAPWRLEAVELLRDGRLEAVAPARRLAFLADGEGDLALRVRDKAGNETALDLRSGLELASEAPLASPAADDKAGPVISALGSTTVGLAEGFIVVRVEDPSGVASLWIGPSGGGPELPVELPATGLRSVEVAIPYAFPPKAGQLSLRLSAVDGGGRRSQLGLSLRLDQAADQPRLRALSPSAGERRTPGQDLIAYLDDNERPGSVSATLGAQSRELEGSDALFRLALDGLAQPGQLNLSLVGADSRGNASPRLGHALRELGPAPLIRLAEFAPGKGSPEAFGRAMSLVVDAGSSIRGALRAPNGPGSLEYRLAGGAWTRVAPAAKPDAEAWYAFALPLPVSLPYGRVELELRAQDAAGLSSSWRGTFYRIAAGAAEDAEGFYFFGPGQGEPALLAPGESLGFRWNGEELAELRLEPSWPGLRAEEDRGVGRLTAVAEGLSPELRLVAHTVRGDEIRSEPFSVTVDASAPELSLEEPGPGAWLAAAETRVQALARDANGIAEASWSLDDGGSWTSVPLGPAAAGERASLELDFLATSPEGDGPRLLLLRVVDRAGRESVVARAFVIDRAPPSFTLHAPALGEPVNGTVTMSGFVEDSGALDRAEYSLDGRSWSPMDFIPAGYGEAVDPKARGTQPSEAAEQAKALRYAFWALVDLGAAAEPERLAFRAVDRAGNAGVYRPLDPSAPAFALDLEADEPTVNVQIPFADEVQRADFVVSGMAFDDDGIAELYWRIDGGEWSRIEGSDSFSLPFALADLDDNDHEFEIYAVDLNGLRGKSATRGFRVSREEPVGALAEPEVGKTVRGLVSLRGRASDANGVAEVWVSVDNGVSYGLAEGREAWSYAVDTTALPDGVHSVYLRLVDAYGTTGFAAGLLAVDNAPPTLELGGPDDGREFSSELVFGGRVADAVGLAGLRYTLTRLGAAGPERAAPIDGAGVFTASVDLRGLEPGWYNLRIEARDAADNAAFEARNVLVRSSELIERVSIYFPMPGERVGSRFAVSGRIESPAPPSSASVYVGGTLLGEAKVDERGWFSLPVGPGSVPAGEFELSVQALTPAGARLRSEARGLAYEEGAWLTIDSHPAGAMVSGRPYLEGSVAWYTEPAERADKAAWAAYQETLKSRRLVGVDLSRDNGRSFEPAQLLRARGPGGPGEAMARFRYRLETQEYPDGELRLIARARFADGSSTQAKIILIVDSTPPDVRIARPAENGRFNDALLVEGTASDAFALESVELALRSGDKARYEVPGFIQGSYLDLHMLGATRFETGMGLSFFDDNVKLQLNVGAGFDAQPSWDNLFGIAGPATPAAELSRFGGYVLGFKLLANLAYLPFGYFFGPDWDFFSMSFAMGASFTYFSGSNELGSMFSPADGKYMVLSAVVGQWEFAKFSFDSSFLKSAGLYLEGGLVFIPSEASTSLDEFIRPNLALGLRIGLF